MVSDLKERGACWHDRKTTSTTSLGTGRIITQEIACQDCGLVRIYKPCKSCEQLTDKPSAQEKR